MQEEDNNVGLYMLYLISLWYCRDEDIMKWACLIIAVI